MSDDIDDDKVDLAQELFTYAYLQGLEAALAAASAGAKWCATVDADPDDVFEAQQAEVPVELILPQGLDVESAEAIEDGVAAIVHLVTRCPSTIRDEMRAAPSTGDIKAAILKLINSG